MKKYYTITNIFNIGCHDHQRLFFACPWGGESVMHRRIYKPLEFLIILLLLLSAGSSLAKGGFRGTDLSGRPCVVNPGFGPFDYRKHKHGSKKLKIVEDFHFKEGVERLKFSDSDLDYTLRAFPNHHRALYVLIRYFTQIRSAGQELHWRFAPPECYLNYAIQFQPSDAKVHLLFGIYAHKIGLQEKAEELYREAVKLEPQFTEAHYNLGLLLVDMERYTEAKKHAIQAYEGGYPLMGLSRRLAAAGYPLE